MRNTLLPAAPVKMKRYMLFLATMLLIGCSGAPQVSQTQRPSGVIIVTPTSSAAAPFPLGDPYSDPLPTQTFTASELGYTGSFAFADTATGVNFSEQVNVPTTPTSVRLSPVCRAYFKGKCVLGTLLQTVVVHDSFGSTTTLYAQ